MVTVREVTGAVAAEDPNPTNTSSTPPRPTKRARQISEQDIKQIEQIESKGWEHLHKLDDPDAATDCFQNVLNLDFNHLGALSGMASACIEQGDPDRARAFCKHYIKVCGGSLKDVDSAGWLLNVYALCFDDGSSEARAGVLRAVEILETDDTAHETELPEALIELGQQCFAANDLDVALGYFERAATMPKGSNYDEMLERLLYIFLFKGQYEKAVEVCRKELGFSSLRDFRLQDATIMSHLQDISSRPFSGDRRTYNAGKILKSLGLAYHDAGQHALSIATFRRLICEGSQYSVVVFQGSESPEIQTKAEDYQLLGMALNADGQKREAKEAYERGQQVCNARHREKVMRGAHRDHIWKDISGSPDRLQSKIQKHQDEPFRAHEVARWRLHLDHMKEFGIDVKYYESR